LPRGCGQFHLDFLGFVPRFNESLANGFPDGTQARFAINPFIRMRVDQFAGVDAKDLLSTSVSRS